MIEIFRKLPAFLDSRARLRLGLLLLPMLVVAVLDMASIGLVLPVIQVLILGEQGGALTGVLLDVVPVTGDASVAVAVAFALVFVVKNVLLLAMVYVVNRTVQGETARFVGRMYALYLARPLVFHHGRNSAVLMRNLTQGAAHTFEVMRQMLMMLLEGLLMAAAFALLLLVRPGVTILVAAVLIGVGALFMRVATPLFRRWGRLSMELFGENLKWIGQSLAGIRDVKLLDAHRFMRDVVLANARAAATYESRAQTAQQVPRLMVETLVVVGFLIIAFSLVAGGGTTADAVPVLGLYGMAALRLMPSMNRILNSATVLRHRAAYVETLHRDLIEGALDAEPGADALPPEPLPFAREIRLEGVSLVYPGAERPALDGIDLAIARGEAIGFVGPSGAGKSTLADVLLGLLAPTAGRLLVDGADVALNRRGWQRRIGYVPQQVQLLDDTLRRNIAFGVADAAIDERRLARVLRQARLGDLVAELPQGLDTVVGERGARLSGGQRQRIAIARALYPDPDVLMLDEATSALDNETEREVADAIARLSGERTVLIIAHRLGTVRPCDRIVFLKEGRVVAVGPFEALMAGNAEFARLAAEDGGRTTEDGEPAPEVAPGGRKSDLSSVVCRLSSD